MRLSDGAAGHGRYGMIDRMDGHEYDRYRIEDPAEMLSLMRLSCASRVLCSVRAAGRPESYLSPIREIADTGEPTLDRPRAPVIERALQAGSTASIDLRLHDFRLGFEARVERMSVSDGKPLLRLSRPEAIVKLQRRDAFKIRVPQGVGVLLTLDATDPTLTALPMHDLCLQGGSLTFTGLRGRFEAGVTFEHASLSLPDAGDWPLSLRIMHAGVQRRIGEQVELRVGVQFLNAPAGFERAVAQVVGGIARDPARARRA
jgi:flagellar brake protein